MSNLKTKAFTRRSILSGVFTYMTSSKFSHIASGHPERPAPVMLGHGLEIRDYRLFPTPDVMRIIVEIHNTSESAVDTPAVGLILPTLESKRNFTWVNPVARVLHPHTSECLIGIAPDGLESDHDWGTPEWHICDSLSTEAAEQLVSHNFQFRDNLVIIAEDEAHLYIDVSNPTDNDAEGWIIMQPTLWDRFDRICGISPPGGTNGLAAHSNFLMNSRITTNYAANPFPLIEDINELTATYSYQPGVFRIYRNNCAPVLPWNNYNSQTS